jgi:hypothetical protein
VGESDQERLSSTSWQDLPSTTGLEEPVNGLALHSEDAIVWNDAESPSQYRGDSPRFIQGYHDTPEVPQLPLPKERGLKLYTNDPWSPFNALNPISAGSSVPGECINPSLLEHCPEESLRSDFIGLPNTGLPHPDGARIHRPANDSEAPNPSTPTSNTKTKRSRNKISREALAVLRDYYDHNVYPSTQELAVIATLSNLEPKTVKYWFDNKRRDRPKRKGKCSF